MTSVHILLIMFLFVFVVQSGLLLILFIGVCKMSAATDAYNAAVTQLTTDVEKLITSSAGGGAAAVDAFATSATQQIDQLDATVKAALPPGV